jgi:hypothetical protein
MTRAARLRGGSVRRRPSLHLCSFAPYPACNTLHVQCIAVQRCNNAMTKDQEFRPRDQDMGTTWIIRLIRFEVPRAHRRFGVSIVVKAKSPHVILPPKHCCGLELRVSPESREINSLVSGATSSRVRNSRMNHHPAGPRGPGFLAVGPMVKQVTTCYGVSYIAVKSKGFIGWVPQGNAFQLLRWHVAESLVQCSP